MRTHRIETRLDEATIAPGDLLEFDYFVPIPLSLDKVGVDIARQLVGARSGRDWGTQILERWAVSRNALAS